jgi:hypothetical protein
VASSVCKKMPNPFLSKSICASLLGAVVIFLTTSTIYWKMPVIIKLAEIHPI